jgi:D-3-phosphoglycerate dehydrogenase
MLAPVARGRVLVTAKSVAGAPAALRAIEAAGHEVLIRSTPTPVDRRWLADQVRDVDALVFAMEPMDAALLAAAPRLKVIARPGVGTDNVDLEVATRRGVIVTLASGTNEQSVADLTLGLLLEAARGISTAAAGVSRGGWERVTGTEVWNKTLAIVGLGRIGRAVAQRARGFDMRVLAVARQRDDDFARRHGVEYATFDDAIARADFISLHAPLTPHTENLVDAAALARMKRGAILINTARGGLVDEPALVAAVRSGHLSGAAVDVLREQGAGSQSPLIGVPGIVVTPHMASFTRESTARVAASVARSVIEALAGRRPEHVANPEVFERR